MYLINYSYSNRDKKLNPKVYVLYLLERLTSDTVQALLHFNVIG